MRHASLERERFFFTIRTPHQLSSGPTFHYFNESHEYISSLEEAKRLALSHQVGVPGSYDYVEVSWGVERMLKPMVMMFSSPDA